VDYKKAENYAVKKFIVHKTINDKKGEPIIQLYTRWKGWRDRASITLEPLQHMVQDWPIEVTKYCVKNDDIKKICLKKYNFLFNKSNN